MALFIKSYVPLKKSLQNIRTRSWKKYVFEFLSIFIAVVSAFMLANWSENRNNAHTEEKILTEINNGIGLDIQDFNTNIIGHNLSLRANEMFRTLLKNEPVPQDSIGLFYTALFRDYTPLINSSGYESLKEAGLKTVTNDSLRFDIITLYDYHYGIIDIVNNIYEMQSFVNYFDSINRLLHPYMTFDDVGRLIGLSPPLGLSETERKEIMSYLWRLESNRRYKLIKYNTILKEMFDVSQEIENELAQ